MSGNGDYISREAVVNGIWKALYSYEDEMEAKFEADPELDVAQWFSHRIFVQTMSSIDLQVILDAPAADVRPVPEGGIGEMSDGYHTFNGLYYQRMVLFASLANAHQDKAWKSWKHEDGKPCFDGGWFIVGIDTPQGSYTYHYEDKYWNWFECEELPVAKHWDGHTEEDVTRLLSLDVQPVVFCGDCTRYFGKEDGGYTAGYCKRTYIGVGPFDFCSRGEKRDETADGR